MGGKKSKNVRRDVCWYAIKAKGKGSKKPIAYSTVAASKLIVALSETHETIQDVYNAIVFDVEAKEVLQKYIEAGYGGEIAKTHFR